jgi:hypothetical protein
MMKNLIFLLATSSLLIQPALAMKHNEGEIIRRIEEQDRNRRIVQSMETVASEQRRQSEQLEEVVRNTEHAQASENGKRLAKLSQEDDFDYISYVQEVMVDPYKRQRENRLKNSDIPNAKAATPMGSGVIRSGAREGALRRAVEKAYQDIEEYRRIVLMEFVYEGKLDMAMINGLPEIEKSKEFSSIVNIKPIIRGKK